jgi:TonB family protein
MGNKDRKSQDPEDRESKYEATVLEFLDEEIAASEKAALPGEARSDVDNLVNSLLEQSLNSTKEAPTPKESEIDDLDRLFSRIAHTLDQTPEPSPISATAAAHKESSKRVVEMPGPKMVHPIPGTAANQSMQESAHSSPKEARNATKKYPVRLPDNLAAPESTEKLKDASAIEEDGKALKTGTDGAAPVFGNMASKPSNNRRTLILISAFLCLLAGTGITLLVKKSPPAQPDSGLSQTPPPAVETQPPAVAARESAPAPSSPSASAPASSAAIPRAGSLAPSAKNPAIPETAANSVNAPTTRETKREAPAPSTAAPTASTEPRSIAPVPEKQVAPPPVLVADASPLTTSTIAAAPAANWNTMSPATRNLAGSASGDLSVSVHKVLTQPVAISKVMPQYPAAATRTHTAGTVAIDVQINEKGNVTKATPISGPNIFYPEAVAAIMQWRFKPATIDGNNIGSSIQVSLVFKSPN